MKDTAITLNVYMYIYIYIDNYTYIYKCHRLVLVLYSTVLYCTILCQIEVSSWTHSPQQDLPSSQAQGQ